MILTSTEKLLIIRGRVLFRAFSSHDDAVAYKNNKIKIMHEHCCVCEDCPNRNYYAEHESRHTLRYDEVSS